MNFKTAVKTCVTEKYACFEGRASRSEYWFFLLFFSLVSSVAIIFGAIIGTENTSMIFSLIAYLALCLPALAVLVRRLHDTNKSGWWSLLSVIPLANLVFIFFLCQKGTDGDNKFGSLTA